MSILRYPSNCTLIGKNLFLQANLINEIDRFCIMYVVTIDIRLSISYNSYTTNYAPLDYIVVCRIARMANDLRIKFPICRRACFAPYDILRVLCTFACTCAVLHIHIRWSAWVCVFILYGSTWWNDFLLWTLATHRCRCNNEIVLRKRTLYISNNRLPQWCNMKQRSCIHTHTDT